MHERERHYRNGLVMLSDPGGAVLRRYGLEDACLGEEVARPAAFLLDGGGVVRWRNLPESWRHRPSAEDYLRAVAEHAGRDVSGLDGR